MKRDRMVAALDLGTTKTCAVIAEATGTARAPGAKILGVGLSKSTGVRRGVVRDIEETTRSIQAALKDAERMAGVEVGSVVCGTAGDHVTARTATGLASVTAEEITRADVLRVEAVAKSVDRWQEYELLHHIPQEYKVDAQGGISDPAGMTGLRLEVEMYLVAVQQTAAQNLRKAVERAGYKVDSLVFEPLASSLAVLTNEEKELGCALVEVGGGSTVVAVFKDGKIRHQAPIPFAGMRVTNDIVQGLGVTQADAERLKEKWGAAYTPLVDAAETIELASTPGQGPRQAKRELLAHIIQERLDEIFLLVQGQLEQSGFAGKLPAGVVLTGGGVEMPGIVELAREVFAMPARVGVPDRGVTGLFDSVQAPRYAVAVGLVLYAARQRGDGGGSSGPDWKVDKLLGPVRRWLQDFF
ncbi:MAG TPA: cell division protein FtsA [Gemmatimonadales bacterium]